MTFPGGALTVVHSQIFKSDAEGESVNIHREVIPEETPAQETIDAKD